MNNNDLYFIPILIKAFEKDELESSVESAINKIKKLGKQKKYQKGYEQFESFLEAGWCSIRGGNYIVRILAGIGMYYLSFSETEREELLKKIESNKDLEKGYQKIRKFFGNESIIIELYMGGLRISEISMDDEEKEILHIEPGNYSVQLNNGRVLWEGEITKEDILYAKSKTESYKMAALTDNLEVEPTKTIELIHNELEMKIYAGLESGRITLNTK